jgi:uncharacterized protein involved in response to NO
MVAAAFRRREQMSGVAGGIPRYRAFGGPALFQAGFRPFFLAAALWPTAGIGLWYLVFTGRVELATGFDPVAWHMHEMLFGFAAAAVAGFMLTAIPNWTGRLPLRGAPLVVLVLLWGGGRAAMLVSATIGPVAAALIDGAFLAALLLAVARKPLRRPAKFISPSALKRASSRGPEDSRSERGSAR